MLFQADLLGVVSKLNDSSDVGGQVLLLLLDSGFRRLPNHHESRTCIDNPSTYLLHRLVYVEEGNLVCLARGVNFFLAGKKLEDFLVGDRLRIERELVKVCGTFGGEPQLNFVAHLVS